jgi:hypothetical protein
MKHMDDIWLVVYLPLWKMMDFVSWDDDIPNMMGKIKIVPNHQPVLTHYPFVGKHLVSDHVASNPTLLDHCPLSKLVCQSLIGSALTYRILHTLVPDDVAYKCINHLCICIYIYVHVFVGFVALQHPITHEINDSNLFLAVHMEIYAHFWKALYTHCSVAWLKSQHSNILSFYFIICIYIYYYWYLHVLLHLMALHVNIRSTKSTSSLKYVYIIAYIWVHYKGICASTYTCTRWMLNYLNTSHKLCKVIYNGKYRERHICACVSVNNHIYFDVNIHISCSLTKNHKYTSTSNNTWVNGYQRN